MSLSPTLQDMDTTKAPSTPPISSHSTPLAILPWQPPATKTARTASIMPSALLGEIRRTLTRGRDLAQRDLSYARRASAQMQPAQMSPDKERRMEQGSGCTVFALRCGRALDVIVWAGGLIRKQVQGARMTLPCAGYLMGPSNVAPEEAGKGRDVRCR